MNQIKEADQGKPYKLIKNIFKHNNQYKELLYIAKSNKPNLTIEEIVEMFKKIQDTGCSCAMVANAIGNQFYRNDEEFKSIFGYSLLTNKNEIDYNRILVDVYSKLYGIAKVRFIEYEFYEFESIREASEKFLNTNSLNDNDTIVKLFEKGITPDGYTTDGKLKFKNVKPKISQYVGSANEIANTKFGINNINSFEDLIKLSNSKNINIECSDIEIYQKLTGLNTENFNFWIDYYFNNSGINYTMESTDINKSDYNTYEDFMKYILELLDSNYSINVDVGPNNVDAYMHTNKKFSWSRIGGETAGHIMLFKNFNGDGDIVVSSYGEDYIIPKQYFKLLNFKKIQKIEKTRQIDSNKTL